MQQIGFEGRRQLSTRFGRSKLGTLIQSTRKDHISGQPLRTRIALVLLNLKLDCDIPYFVTMLPLQFYNALKARISPAII